MSEQNERDTAINPKLNAAWRSYIFDNDLDPYDLDNWEAFAAGASYQAGQASRSQWVRCDDRLPYKEGVYLATFEDEDQTGVIPVYMAFDGTEEMKPRFQTYDSFMADPGEIIAWMPLPQPYTEEK